MQPERGLHPPRPLLHAVVDYLLRRYVAAHTGNDSVGQVKELKSTSIIDGADPSARSHSDQTDAPSGTSREDFEWEQLVMASPV
jgi:hypothetical protein